MNIGIYKSLLKFYPKLQSLESLKRLFGIVFFLLICFTKAYSQDLNNTISIELKNTSLSVAIEKISKSSGFQINYDQNIIQGDERITFSVINKPIKEVLDRILNPRQIGYKETGKSMLILFTKSNPQTKGRITGKVYSENGEPLFGASIRVLSNANSSQADNNGDFSMALNPGIYTVEISYISYKTKRITDVKVSSDRSTSLTVSLIPQDNALEQVVITSTYKKNNSAGLLARQKNAHEISNGISAEQIQRTSDLHIGESLKRVSGLNTVDNKFVIIRGIGERYNSAMLDGTVLPSTEANSRQFSFDLIPSDLVDNVVVSKTPTSDMNASFAGGLVQINTKDIPTENFASITIGGFYNDQSTGKEFLSHKRGKYDFLALDDGRRDFPSDLRHTVQNAEPNNTLTEDQYLDFVVEQSKKFTNDNLSVFRYKSTPSQNYQFTLGRIYELNDDASKKIGFIAAISYRNTQNIDNISTMHRGDFAVDQFKLDSLKINNAATDYKFSSNWGATLNAGLQTGISRFSFKNTYTKTFSNNLMRTIGYLESYGETEIENSPPTIEEADRPIFTELLQNKISGEHKLSMIKLDWDLAHTRISRKEKDIVTAQVFPRLLDDKYVYYYFPSPNPTEQRIKPISRQSYANGEKHFTWSISGTYGFNFLNQNQSLKAGYFGQRKVGDFNWVQVSLYANSTANPSLNYRPVQEMVDPQNMGINGYQYRIGSGNMDRFDGKNSLNAFYFLFNNKFTDKLKLVWGLRVENFKYLEHKTPSRGALLGQKTDTIPEKNWSFLPSANLTYNLTSKLNFRAAWSNVIVRPELMDNNEFLIYSPYLGGQFSNFDLKSSQVNSLDLKAEWYPAAGEILAIGGFYKYFDQPIELAYTTISGGASAFLQKNSDFAKIIGLELELRKNLGFISPTYLSNLVAFGNLTLQRSTVQASFSELIIHQDGTSETVIKQFKNDRPMYGNAPFILNAGLQYDDGKLNLNIAYNKTGYKTYIISNTPEQIEYEMPRNQLDFQVGYRFLKDRLLIKANAANILNSSSTFFKNSASYINSSGNQVGEKALFKDGFSEKYDVGDRITYKYTSGRTYSIIATYSF